MPIATRAEVRGTQQRIDEQFVKLAKSLKDKDLFLAHSHHDQRELGGAISILKSAGADVYVDAEDAALRDLSGQALAKRLRDAILTCRRTVVLVSKHSSSSRWLPWEMGLTEGCAGANQLALFPLADGVNESEVWSRQEYFQLYAQIQPVLFEGDRERTWGVATPDGLFYRLSNWIRMTQPKRPLR